MTGLAVRETLAGLPANERVALELRLDGYEVQEIAGRIGRSKRSVERSLQKAVEHLQVKIGPGEAGSNAGPGPG